MQLGMDFLSSYSHLGQERLKGMEYHWTTANLQVADRLFRTGYSSICGKEGELCFKHFATLWDKSFFLLFAPFSPSTIIYNIPHGM